MLLKRSPPIFTQKIVEILRRILLVLREDLDDIFQRFPLELVELSPLCCIHICRTHARVGRGKDADEATRCLVVVAETPVAPGTLEQRQIIKRWIDLHLVRKNLLVLGEGARVVEPSIEDRLRLRHVRIGDEARLRKVSQDRFEVLARLVFPALLESEKAVDIEGDIVFVEPLVVAQDTPELLSSDSIVQLRRWAALANRPFFPIPETRDEPVAFFLPLKLAEANESLGHLV